MELGIGAGWKEDEWRAYGYGFPDTPDRLANLHDQLEVITRMLAPGRSVHATYDGRYARVEDAVNVPKPIQQPRVPIMVGGNGPNVTWRLAARFADELNVDGLRQNELRDALPVIRGRCEEIGRDPATLRVSVHLFWNATRHEGTAPGRPPRRLPRARAEPAHHHDPRSDHGRRGACVVRGRLPGRRHGHGLSAGRPAHRPREAPIAAASAGRLHQRARGGPAPASSRQLSGRLHRRRTWPDSRQLTTVHGRVAVAAGFPDHVAEAGRRIHEDRWSGRHVRRETHGEVRRACERPAYSSPRGNHAGNASR